MRGGVLQLALRQLGLELGHLGDACLFKRLATLLEPRAHRLERHLLLLRTLLDRLLDVSDLLLVPLGRLIGGPFGEGLLALGLCLCRRVALARLSQLLAQLAELRFVLGECRLELLTRRALRLNRRLLIVRNRLHHRAFHVRELLHVHRLELADLRLHEACAAAQLMLHARTLPTELLGELCLHRSESRRVL